MVLSADDTMAFTADLTKNTEFAVTKLIPGHETEQFPVQYPNPTRGLKSRKFPVKPGKKKGLGFYKSYEIQPVS